MLGGIPNKTKVGDMGIDWSIFPVSNPPTKPAARKGETQISEEFLDHWNPIQVKQKDPVGRRFQGKGLMASAFYPLGAPTTLRVTLHADEWPTHLQWDESAKRLLKPLLEAAHKASRPKLRVVRPRLARQNRVAKIAAPTP